MIRFGPGGTNGLGYDESFKELVRLGLNALEVEFTYGVRMSIEEAKRIGKLAKSKGISLSVHAPYYINLASKEKVKVDASIKRILDSCERAHHLGATHVVYHSGFFQKEDPKIVSKTIIENTQVIMDAIADNKFNTLIAPELTGKPTQYGSIPELLKLHDKTGCAITIDFAHEKARNNGKIDYASVFDSLKGIKHIHSHFSGIEWTKKGEKNHKITEEEDILPFVAEVVKRKHTMTIINESPAPINDALKTKKVYEKLQK